MANNFLDLYFERIRYSRSPGVNLQTLRDLHLLHLQHIPYENIDVFCRRGVALDPLAGEGDLGPHQPEGEQARARDPAVQHVADDPDPLAVERAEVLPQREDVEQRLAGVLVLAVPGIDHRGLTPAGDQVGGAGMRRANHDRLGPIGADVVRVGPDPDLVGIGRGGRQHDRSARTLGRLHRQLDSGTGNAGNRILMTVPRPGCDSTRVRPPLWATIP